VDGHCICYGLLVCHAYRLKKWIVHDREVPLCAKCMIIFIMA